MVVRGGCPTAVRHLVELDLHYLPLAIAATQLVTVHAAAAAAMFRRLLDRAVVAIFRDQLALTALDTFLTHRSGEVVLRGLPVRHTIHTDLSHPFNLVLVHRGRRPLPFCGSSTLIMRRAR